MIWKYKKKFILNKKNILNFLKTRFTCFQIQHLQPRSQTHGSVLNTKLKENKWEEVRKGRRRFGQMGRKERNYWKFIWKAFKAHKIIWKGVLYSLQQRLYGVMQVVIT